MLSRRLSTDSGRAPQPKGSLSRKLSVEHARTRSRSIDSESFLKVLLIVGYLRCLRCTLGRRFRWYDLQPFTPQAARIILIVIHTTEYCYYEGRGIPPSPS